DVRFLGANDWFQTQCDKQQQHRHCMKFQHGISLYLQRLYWLRCSEFIANEELRRNVTAAQRNGIEFNTASAIKFPCKMGWWVPRLHLVIRAIRRKQPSLTHPARVSETTESFRRERPSGA